MTDLTTGIRKVSLAEMADVLARGEIDDVSVLWLPRVSGRSLFGKLLEPLADGTAGLIAYNAFGDLEFVAEWLAGQGIDSASLLIESGPLQID